MFKDMVIKNRSYRGFDENRVITREELTEMVDCARLAPSSVNAQPFRYYLIHDQEEADKMQPLVKWAKALPHLELPHQGMKPTAFIIICQDTQLGESLTRYQKDVGIVAQTILLAATEMGLGGCMIGNYNGAVVKEAFHLAENLVPMLVVAIGKPMENIILTEAEEGADIAYYRDEADHHYVPKRKLKDIIVN